MTIAIIGGGVSGLALAMNLHQRGIDCHVLERAAEVRELGVGITLLPHAMREFAALGVAEALRGAGVETLESCFFNRFGQLIYKEPRGRHAGYDHPEVMIHRGRLHVILFNAALARLGPERILTDRECVAVEQDETGAVVHLRHTTTGATLPPMRAEAVIACDGVNSLVRRQFYPDETVAFAGINTWRGVTRRKPFLTGQSYTRTGSILTGKIVIYPIIAAADDDGGQLINWMAEIKQESFEKNDWNRPGDMADFFPIYKDWRFDWLDVASLIENAEQVLKYPMVDKDPVAQWSFGCVTFAGDAAHPMYPRGSNGAAQATIDARVLADCLASDRDRAGALKAYEAARLEPTAKIVRTNREHPPDFLNIKVEELVGDRPFDDLGKYITQQELRALSDNYKRIAGFSVADVAASRAEK
ncbi:MAG: flavin-dependent oxidoreductase [Proteobacteria bacterium]|nr:flavin-dependent oxidoreductase [Pseudomonadota bacterium]